MGSRERLWTIFGEAWGWPPASMTVQQDGEELARHADEMRRRLSYNYAVLDEAESELLGCVYVDPPSGADDADAIVSWWVVDAAVGTALDVALAEQIPSWMAEAWPFGDIRYGV